jgi:hypothetical protein
MPVLACSAACDHDLPPRPTMARSRPSSSSAPQRSPTARRAQDSSRVCSGGEVDGVKPHLPTHLPWPMARSQPFRCVPLRNSHPPTLRRERGSGASSSGDLDLGNGIWLRRHRSIWGTFRHHERRGVTMPSLRFGPRLSWGGVHCPRPPLCRAPYVPKCAVSSSTADARTDVRAKSTF